MNTEIIKHPKWPAGQVVGSQAYGKYTVYELKGEDNQIHYCCEHLVQTHLDCLHGLIDHMDDHIEYFKVLARSRQKEVSLSE